MLTAQQPENFIPALLNFPPNTLPVLSEILHSERTVETSFQYIDLYRKRTKSTPLLQWATPDWRASVSLPGHFRTGKYLIQMGLHRSTMNLRNTRDHTAIQGHLNSHNTSGQFGFAVTDSIAMAGIRFSAGRSAYTMPLEITQFPQTDNDALRKYFFRWIEPAFGQNGELKGTSESINPEIYMSVPILRGYRFALSYSALSMRYQPDYFYTNRSNKPELAGPREMSFPTDITRKTVQGRVETPGRHLNFSLNLFNTRLKTAVDNHPPVTEPVLLDFTSLGSGEFLWNGGNVLTYWEYGHTMMQIGAGYSEISGSFSLVTPVLGYYDDLFPVAHGISGQIHGKTLSEMLSLGYDWSVFGLDGRTGIDYIHATPEYRLDGEAQMEFNLVSQPVHYPVHYRVNFIAVRVLIGKTFKSSRIGYKFAQSIPWIKRTDHSPVQIRQPRPHLKYVRDGGATYTICYTYKF